MILATKDGPPLEFRVWLKGVDHRLYSSKEFSHFTIWASAFFFRATCPVFGAPPIPKEERRLKSLQPTFIVYYEDALITPEPIPWLIENGTPLLTPSLSKIMEWFVGREVIEREHERWKNRFASIAQAETEADRGSRGYDQQLSRNLQSPRKIPPMVARSSWR